MRKTTRRAARRERRSTLDLLCLPGLMLLLGFVVPMYIVANNLPDYQHIDVGFTALTLLVVSSVGAVLAWLLSMALAAVEWARPVFVLFRFAFFFALITGFVLPLTEGGGQLEAAEIPLATGNLGIAAALAGILTAATLTRAHGLLMSVALTVLVGNGVSSTVAVVRGIVDREVESLFQVSAGKNVFVLSFDGLTRDATLEVVRENAELAEALKDFTLFEQVSSSAVATATSIMSELAGVRDLKGEFPTEGALYAGLIGDSVLSNALNDHGFQVSTYGTYSSSLAEQSNAVAYGGLTEEVTVLNRVDQTMRIFEYAIARTGSSRAVFGRDAARWLAGVIWRDAEKRKDVAQDLHVRTANHRGRDWDVSSILTFVDFERYVANLQVGTREPVAHFLHFTHTHYPVDFDRDCVYRSDDAAWYAANQNRAGAKAETQCAVSQFGRFLETLKELGVYDGSLIVLKSDHGKPVAYNDAGRYEGFAIRGHPNWGFARYTPFLAIKPVGGSAAASPTDWRHVSLSDLAYSICNATIAGSFDCDRFGGYDLLNPSAEVPPEASYFVYLVKDAGSDWRLDTHEVVELPRRVEFFTALNELLTSELLLEAPACDTPIPLVGGAPYNNGATDESTWVTWRNGDSRFLKIRAPDCEVREAAVSLRWEAAASAEFESASLRISGEATPQVPPGAVTVSDGLSVARFDLPPAMAGAREFTFEFVPAPPGVEMRIESIVFSR